MPMPRTSPRARRCSKTVLAGVPSVALYIVNPMVVGYGRRMQKKIFKARYITLPNLVLERELVPELLQERRDPAKRSPPRWKRCCAIPRSSTRTSPKCARAWARPNALDDAAKFAVALAKAGQR